MTLKTLLNACGIPGTPIVVTPAVSPLPGLTNRAAIAGVVKARIYRTTGDPEDPTVGPSWAYRCDPCGESGNGCLHQVLHEPGTWKAAMCAGLHHVHRRHRDRVWETQTHTQLGGRRRCNWGAVSDAERRLATLVLCGRTGYPRGELAREVAREVLALAGIRTP